MKDNFLTQLQIKQEKIISCMLSVLDAYKEDVSRGTIEYTYRTYPGRIQICSNMIHNLNTDNLTEDQETMVRTTSLSLLSMLKKITKEIIQC